MILSIFIDEESWRKSMAVLLCSGADLVSKSCPAVVTPQTVTHQAPLSMGFPKQEYWSGLPLLFPGGLPNPGI